MRRSPLVISLCRGGMLASFRPSCKDIVAVVSTRASRYVSIKHDPVRLVCFVKLRALLARPLLLFLARFSTSKRARYNINTTEQLCQSTLGGEKFDAVFDMNAREVSDTKAIADVFKGKVDHYVFMSSAGVYLKSELMPHREVRGRRSCGDTAAAVVVVLFLLFLLM